MAFCSNCGVSIADNIKFCPECGSPNAKGSSDATQRRQEYAGKIIKCPNCGEVLKSFETVCPTCKHELRGSRVADSVAEFSQQFVYAASIGQKTDLIKSFPIPNTKEDILEFMILAASNVDVDSYKIVGTENEKQVLSSAWLSKMEQAYQKAEMLFSEVPEFAQMKNLYERKKHGVNLAQTNAKRRKILIQHGAVIRKCCLFSIMLIVIAVMTATLKLHIALPKYIEEIKFNIIVQQTKMYIDGRKFQTARIAANKIIPSKKYSDEYCDKWYEIRNELLNKIDDEEKQANQIITIGFEPRDFKNQNYEQVIAQLKSKGFVNVKSSALGDLTTGWIHSKGEVKEISINGEINFTAQSQYRADVEVIVYYHSF